MVSRGELRDRYQRVRERIGEAAERSGRRAAEIICVAVTKYATPDQVRQLIEMGHRDLGESRVQQLQQRVAMSEEFLSRRRMMIGQAAPDASPGAGGSNQAPATHAPGADEVRWHLVGHLQRNKVRAVLGLVKLIHSTDSLRLAEEIESQAARADREVDVLLQVNSSGEAGKFGLPPAAVSHFAEQVATMPHLRVRGLMTMAPYSSNPEDARPVFTRTAELFADTLRDQPPSAPFNILSMGMSNDFEVAIECGANVVRIGSALFGEPVTIPRDP